MKARDQKTSYAGIDHNARIASDNVALNVTGAILVGGQARRFGGAFKPSLRVGNDSIIVRQIASFRAAGIDDVVVVGKSPLSFAGVRHVADAVEGGALGGLYSALLVATHPVVVVLAGDMPFVTASLVRCLVRLIGDEDAVVPRVDGQWHPLCGAYRRSIASRLKARLDRHEWRVTDALGDLRVRALETDELTECDATDMPLMNVNTPDDHREAERLARAQS